MIIKTLLDSRGGMVLDGAVYTFLDTGNVIVLGKIKSSFDGQIYYYINGDNSISCDNWNKLMEELDRVTSNN